MNKDMNATLVLYMFNIFFCQRLQKPLHREMISHSSEQKSHLPKDHFDRFERDTKYETLATLEIIPLAERKTTKIERVAAVVKSDVVLI